MNKLIFVFIGILFCLNGFSQEIRSYVISSTGASIMGDNGSLYLSIGEPMNTEISGGDIMISQGFLQVSISESTSTDELLSEEINVFPNPSTADLHIELPEMEGDYIYHLYDNLGKTIETKNIQQVRTKVNLTLLDPGTYFLKVTKASKSSRTLKIIKL